MSLETSRWICNCTQVADVNWIRQSVFINIARTVWKEIAVRCNMFWWIDCKFPSHKFLNPQHLPRRILVDIMAAIFCYQPLESSVEGCHVMATCQKVAHVWTLKSFFEKQSIGTASLRPFSSLKKGALADFCRKTHDGPSTCRAWISWSWWTWWYSKQFSAEIVWKSIHNQNIVWDMKHTSLNKCSSWTH